MSNRIFYLILIFLFRSESYCQTQSGCCDYLFTDLGNFPSNVGGVNIKIGKQKTACGSAQDQSFKLVLTNKTDYKVVVSGFFYAITTCGQKLGTKFLNAEIGPKGTLSGNDIFIWDMTGLTFGVSKLDCKGVAIGCSNNNLIDKLGVEDIKVEYPQFDAIRKQNQNETVWQSVPYYRINSSAVEMKIGKQKAGNGELQKFWLYVRNNSDKKLQLTGTYFAQSICGNTSEFQIQIDLNPGDVLQGTGNHLSDINGLTGYLENGSCQTFQLGNQIENDIISVLDVKNIRINYLDEVSEEIASSNSVSNSSNSTQTPKTEEEPKKNTTSSSDNSNGYNNYYTPDRRVQYKEASDALTAASLGSFATMGAFIMANDYGYTSYQKNKMAFNLSLGIAINQIPLLTTENSDLNPTVTDFDAGGGAGLAINSEYWIMRGPKKGLAGFYNCDITSFSMVGNPSSSSFGMSGNYGLKTIVGKKKIKGYGEFSFGKRTASSEYDFDMFLFPNVYHFHDYGYAQYGFRRTGIGLFFDFTGDSKYDDQEISLEISYLTDKIRGLYQDGGSSSQVFGINGTNYQSIGSTGRIVKIDFKMAMINFYLEIGNKKYPSIGEVQYPYALTNDSRDSYYKIGILTGLTVFSTK